MTNQYVPTLIQRTRRIRNRHTYETDQALQRTEEKEKEQQQRNQQIIDEAISKMMNPQTDSSDLPMDYGSSMEDM